MREREVKRGSQRVRKEKEEEGKWGAEIEKEGWGEKRVEERGKRMHNGRTNLN